MNEPLLSIVSVVRNAKVQLSKTISSIQEIEADDMEFIVVDGNSTDGTLELIKKSRTVDNFISEPDSGIFDAMNKGIKLANGKWMIFINAGDEVRFNKSIFRKLDKAENFAVVYGDTLRSNGTISKPHELHVLKFGTMPMCHQSIFFNSDVLKDELYYKTSFSLFGENELMMRIYKKGFCMKYINQLVSFFEGGGISDQISWITRIARFLYIFHHFGIVQLFYSLSFRITRRNKYL